MAAQLAGLNRQEVARMGAAYAAMAKACVGKPDEIYCEVQAEHCKARLDELDRIEAFRPGR